MALRLKETKPNAPEPPKVRVLEGVERAAASWYVLRDANVSVEITNGRHRDVLDGDPSDAQRSHVPVNFASWGHDNLLPQKMLRLISENHLKPQLIYTSRNFLLGSRLGVFKRVVKTSQAGDTKIALEPVIDPQIEDFMEGVEADRYMRRAAYNLEEFFNVFSSFSLNARKKIDEITCWDGTDVRAEKIPKGKGKIQKYFIHPNWEFYNRLQEEVMTLPAYDPKEPTRYGQFMYHGKDEQPGQAYYPQPAWYGTRRWTKVSNLVPQYHESGLTNGYNIKYHIKIPADYFLQFGDKAQATEEALMNDLNKFLSGVQNVDKAFISKFATDQFGKPIPGWEILPVDNKMTDKAYMDVDRAANIAHTSGHGLLPALAGIDTGSKLGGSGSELRIAYQMHIALHTPVKRAILTDPFNKVAKRIEGWNREHFIGFEDVQITTLEDNPNGQQKVTNQAQ